MTKGRRLQQDSSDLHCGQSGVNCSAASLHSNHRIEGTNCCLKGFEVAILIRENTEMANVNAKAHSCMYVLLRGLEPGITLSL